MEKRADRIPGLVTTPDMLLLEGEGNMSKGDAVPSPMGLKPARFLRPVVRLDVDDHGAGLEKILPPDVDLVSARRGYIAPIDIVVGPLNDSEARQAAAKAARIIAAKPDNAA